jgi:FAD/FMN-containing dehydrogenase
LIRPSTIEELTDFLKRRGNFPLHITSLDNTNSPVESLSMASFDRIISYEPEEMIIIAEAGISLYTLNKSLEEKGQWIPTLVCEEHPETTLGAAVARDHYHPRSQTLGMLRTTILGGTFITTSGEVFKSGSRVVKSVAGYDMHRAFCGSNGSFGIMIHLTLKVSPLPEMFYHLTTPISYKEKLLSYHPSIIVEYEGKLFVELSGMKEDILADIEDMGQHIVSHSKLQPAEAKHIIKDIIASHPKKRLGRDSNEYGLLQDLKRVFDPKGVLV